MQRYFVKEKINEEFILYEKDYHHIKNVMRMKQNDKIELVYNNNIYIAKIVSIIPLKLNIVDTYMENSELPIDIAVAVSLVQEQKFDLILQKLTELGVKTIIPVKTTRSIIKIDKQKEDKKYQRWSSICKEASEQSKRISIPKIEKIVSIDTLKDYQSELKLICSLQKDAKPLNYYLLNNQKSILFFIGPEGGITKEEEDCLEENDFKKITLGKRVMRVETAAIYVASVINYIYGG